MFLKEITTKKVNTKFGEKEKYLVKDENGKMYDSWVSGWNNGWKSGQEVAVEPSQISEREWEGKKYYTINAPANAKGAGGEKVMTALQNLWNELQKVKEQNQMILNKLEQQSKMMDEVPPPDDELARFGLV